MDQPQTRRLWRQVGQYTLTLAVQVTQRLGGQHEFAGDSPGANPQRGGVKTEGFIIGFRPHRLDQAGEQVIFYPLVLNFSQLGWNPCFGDDLLDIQPDPPGVPDQRGDVMG